MSGALTEFRLVGRYRMPRSKKRYGYEQVKVARHYGERDDLQEFLDKANENSWEIVQALDVGNGYYAIIYSMSS